MSVLREWDFSSYKYNLNSFDFQEVHGVEEFNQRGKKIASEKRAHGKRLNVCSEYWSRHPVYASSFTADQRINLKAAVRGMWYACVCIVRVRMCMYVCLYVHHRHQKQFRLIKSPEIVKMMS